MFLSEILNQMGIPFEAIDEKAVKEYIDAPQMRDKLPIKMK